MNKNDYNNALSDFTKYIELVPQDVDGYKRRS